MKQRSKNAPYLEFNHQGIVADFGCDQEGALTRGSFLIRLMMLVRSLPLPAPGSAAGQYQPTLGDGEADLFGFHMTAELFRQGGIHHIGQHGGLQSCSVRIDQEEQRIIG